MAEFRPTAAQSEAIRARGGAVLVSAGAGSGKTRVLTERLMGYLTDPDAPAELDSFLVITFTKAAAGELKGRILEALAQAQAADPGNLRLRRQSALCRAAHIGTIHSFCGTLLRQHSALAGLTPDFSVADEDRAAAMRAAALERVLDGRYERQDAYPGFSLLADTVGAGRDDRRLAELTLELYEKMQCHARPERWAAEQAALLDAPAGDAGQTPWGRELLEGALASAEYWLGELRRLLSEMEGSGKLEQAYAPSIRQTAEQTETFCRCLRLGWDQARACLPIAFPRLGSLRNSPDPALSDWVKERREACKKAMKGLETALSGSSEKLLRELRSTAPAMKALLALVLDFDKEYARDKRRAGLVDYADLEHMTARLLTEADGSPSALAKQISLRYTEIMVDEYQDVSRVQEEIFRAVSREGRNLFLVGDVKQSIYRFRLADPGIFTEKYLSWPDKAEPGEPRRVLLRENFRSRREVLDAANSVFSLCMSPELGDIAYDEAAALIPGADYPGPGAAPELLLLEQPPAGAPDGQDKTAREAALAARIIRELVDSGAAVTENGRQRPVGYGDIAILLRSANTVGGVYRRELAKRGIPTAAGQSGEFFRSAEVSSALSLLALIDDPHQDIPLIAALRCPALGFSADELAAVRAADSGADLYTALTKRAETDGKSRAFLEKLDGLRRAAPDLSASELVWRVLESFDLPAVCAAMPDGERRRARLTALAELAGPFEASGYRGLHRFVLWLRKLADRGWEPSLGAESASSVQILSVHRSKGLEFPVVFLCDTGRRFNRQDSQETVLVHPELGLGPKVTDLDRRVEYPSLARSAVKRRLEREMLSEEMRLLYVALTRAKERLYITGSLREPEKALEKARGALTRPMPPQLLAQAASPLQWLLYAALADNGAHLKLRLCAPGEKEAEERREEPAPEADGALLRELERRLAFRYAHQAAAELPSKLTATEMKGREEPDPEAQSLSPAPLRPSFRLPDFTRKDRPLSGAERGTATHLALQAMDFARTGDLEAVRGEIERLRRERFLTGREARAVDAAAIVRLFASPLGRRIREADAVRREFKFSLLWDAEDALGAGAGEELLMQGVVDCFIEEAGRITVIDYKTDAVRTEEDLRRRAQRYAGQLRTYARALERICRKPVKECLLFFLAAGRAVSVPIEG